MLQLVDHRVHDPMISVAIRLFVAAIKEDALRRACPVPCHLAHGPTRARRRRRPWLRPRSPADHAQKLFAARLGFRHRAQHTTPTLPPNSPTRRWATSEGCGGGKGSTSIHERARRACERGARPAAGASDYTAERTK